MTHQNENQTDQTAEDLVQVCRRLYDAIDRLDTPAAALANVSRNVAKPNRERTKPDIWFRDQSPGPTREGKFDSTRA